MAEAIEPLNDLSPFPFGVHKGSMMMHVPARYLLDLHSELLEYPEVGAYIHKARNVLLRELSDEANDIDI